MQKLRDKTVFSSIIARSVFVLGLIVLFCHIAPPQDLLSKSIQITFGESSSPAVFLQADNKTQEISFNRCSGYKKSFSFIQRDSYPPRYYRDSAHKKTINAVVGTNYIFKRHLQKAYLLLDTPPPSYF
jgi:hypothetical protein